MQVLLQQKVALCEAAIKASPPGGEVHEVMNLLVLKGLPWEKVHVGPVGFEPTTPRSSVWRSPRLSYRPKYGSSFAIIKSFARGLHTFAKIMVFWFLPAKQSGQLAYQK